MQLPCRLLTVHPPLLIVQFSSGDEVVAQPFFITYSGLDADQHYLDMRRFGDALVGLDKVIVAGLIAVSDYRLPKKGERFPLRLRASEPREGSVAVVGELAPALAPFAASTLPLVHETFYTGAGDVIWRWLSWVLNMAGGREREADPHFLKLAELFQEVHRGRFESEEANRRFMLDLFDRIQPQAKHVVAPIGPSANECTISPDKDAEADRSTSIDLPMADAIRSKEKLTVGDMEKMRVRVDGLIHHNKQLKIENPDEAGKFISARVQDPAFLEEDNVYTRAVAARGFLDVSAKPSRRADGALHTLYILDAKQVPQN